MSARKSVRVSLTMSRTTGGNCPDRINLTVTDRASRLEFLDLDIPLQEFAMLVTGQGGIRAHGEVRGLDKVGLTRETKPLEFKLPSGGARTDRDQAARIAPVKADPGWEPSLYFSGQDSFFTKDGERWARTHQYRYVDKSEGPAEKEEDL